MAPILEARRWAADGVRVALATVVRTWGSSPRPAGSHMALSEDGRFVGSVSAGCVEGAVLEETKGVFGDGVPRRVEYGVTNEEAWAVGLSCGGRLTVHIALVTSQSLEPLAAAIEAQEPVVAVIPLGAGGRSTGGELTVLTGEALGALESPRSEGDEVPDDAIVDASRIALLMDEPGVVEAMGDELLIRPYSPPTRVVIVGAVHAARALSEMVVALGWEAVIVDPRSAFAQPDGFPGARVVCAWPDEAFDELRLDTRTAVVTLTHDPKVDDPALLAALDSAVFYVGALGSKRTHAARLERLRSEAGAESSDLERIHSPVGLPLGAKTPEEIAVSIIAQLVAVRRGKAGG